MAAYANLSTAGFTYGRAQVRFGAASIMDPEQGELRVHLQDAQGGAPSQSITAQVTNDAAADLAYEILRHLRRHAPKRLEAIASALARGSD